MEKIFQNFTRNLITLLGIFLFGLFFTGCQSLQPTNPGELSLKNNSFIGLWDAYNDCWSASNPKIIKVNLETLQAAPTPISLNDSPIPVPKFLKNLSSNRNSRLAVDPRAMAASCAIHLAEMAHQTADLSTSIQTWQHIVDQYPEPQYAFYTLEASQALKEFASIQPASLSPHDDLGY